MDDVTVYPAPDRLVCRRVGDLGCVEQSITWPGMWVAKTPAGGVLCDEKGGVRYFATPGEAEAALVGRGKEGPP